MLSKHLYFWLKVDKNDTLQTSFVHVSGRGHAVAQFVEELRYKPEGRGIDSRWNQWNFSLT
jgi:hypothetical protein